MSCVFALWAGSVDETPTSCGVCLGVSCCCGLVTVGVWLGTSLTRDHRGVAKEQRSRAARALYATKYHPPEEDDQSMV